MRPLADGGRRACRYSESRPNAFALTVHMTQGLTLFNVTISFDCSMYASGHAYTALSRAQRMDQMQIGALDRDAFKVDSDAVQEFARLEA